MAKASGGLSNKSQLVARLGLAAIFIYAGVSIFLKPDDWVGFIPTWVTELSPLTSLQMMQLHAVFELALAALLLANWKTRFVGLVAALDLLSILLLYGVDPVTFRDIGLVALALTLVF